jgi:hypothetical protein
MSFWKTGDGDVEFFKEQDGCNSTRIVHTFKFSNGAYLEMNDYGDLKLKWEEGDKECERRLAYNENDIANIITWLIRTYKKLF